MKASEHILEGCKTVKENRMVFVFGSERAPFGCALGTGLINKIGFNAAMIAAMEDIGSIGVMLGIPEEVADEVSMLHYKHNFSREQIAEWLKQAGY